MENENKNVVALDDQDLEEVDGGLFAELGLAAAMTFGQVAPAAATMRMNEEPIIEQANVQTVELKKENIELDGDLTENGSAQEQAVKVTVNGVVLVKDVDYQVKNNVANAAGTYTLTVEGIGSYSGKVEVDFTVAAAPVVEEAPVETVDVPEEPQVEEAAPVVEEEAPVQTVDVPEEPQEEEAPAQEEEAPVEKTNIKDAEVTFEDNLVYNGEVQSNKITVTLGDKVLEGGKDYYVEDNAQVEPGTYTATVYGQGDYEGTITYDFTIAEAPVEKTDIKDAKVTFEDNLVYNGEVQSNKITVTLGDKVLEGGTDYYVEGNAQVEPGTYTATVYGKGDYEGAITYDFTIAEAPVEKTDIKDAKVTFENNLVYNGEAQSNKITVTLGDKVLEGGKDFVVGGNRVVNAGNYTATIKGIGDYEGSTTYSFTIAPAPIESVELVGQLVYNGSPQTQGVKVTALGHELTPGTDYEVGNARAQDVGTYTLAVVGNGNYTGIINKNFSIIKDETKTSIKDAKVTLENSLVYNGTPQSNKIKVTLGDKVLEGGKDFLVEGNVAVNAGTYTATVHGIGGYKDAITYSYTIEQATLGAGNVALGAQLVENGKDQAQSVVVKAGNVTLQEGVDYTVSNNVAKKVGTYTLTVKGKGNYKGEVNVNFTIKSSKDSVHTGEKTNVGLYAGAAAAAVAGLGILGFLLRRKRR